MSCKRESKVKRKTIKVRRKEKTIEGSALKGSSRVVKSVGEPKL